MDRNEQHLFTVKKILKDLRERQIAIDFQIMLFADEERKTVNEIKSKNEKHLKEVGLLK